MRLKQPTVATSCVTRFWVTQKKPTTANSATPPTAVLNNSVLKNPSQGAEATLPWLDEQANMRKEKNFFETKVTEYQTGGGLKWD